MLKQYKADLHIHTCLSPCADWDMTPRNIVAQSRAKGLDMIAICDHNTAENAAVTIELGKKEGLCVLAGMEVCTREEVHILSLFDTIEAVLKMQALVYENLPGQNNPDLFGYQVIADEKDRVVAESERLLIGATSLGLDEIVTRIHALGGKSIASHVDRPAFGIFGQLGFIPNSLSLDGVEISYRTTVVEARQNIPGIDRYACLCSSDAHFVSDIGKTHTPLLLAAPSFDEFCLALENKAGRKVDS